MGNPFEWQDNCKVHPSNSLCGKKIEGEKRYEGNALQKSPYKERHTAVLGTGLGQPALGCNDWLWERTCDLGLEVEKLDVDLDSDLFRILFEEELTPVSVVLYVSIHMKRTISLLN